VAHLRDAGFVLREYSFGIRDLFVQCVVVAEKADADSPASGSFVFGRAATA
jgi:hypothetical protein